MVSKNGLYALVVDTAGRDIANNAECAPHNEQYFQIPPLLKCSNFTKPTGYCLTFHMWFEKQVTSLHDNNNERPVVDMKLVNMERLLVGSGYDINEEGVFIFKVPLSSSSFSRFGNGSIINMFNISIDEDQMFDVTYRAVTEAIHELYTRQNNISSLTTTIS
jgi:hypothetical protein